MSLRLIKPGMRSADLTGKIHPKTGLSLVPIGFLRDGTAVWPQMGAASDDPDDPAFTDPDVDDPDDDDEDEDEDDDSKGKAKKPTKKKKVDAADEDDDDDEDDKPPTRPERQAARYRVKLREAEKANVAMAARLKALEDKDKPADEVIKREAVEAKTKADQLAEKLRGQTLKLAFFESNTVDWVDAADALRLVDLDEVDVDDDGTVDTKALRLALKDLAKRKPHLVKPVASDKDDDEDDEDDKPTRQRRTAPALNGRRKGQGKEQSRAELAKKFPILGR